MVPDRRHRSELIPGFGRPVLLYRYRMLRSSRKAAYVRVGYGYLGSVVPDRTPVFSMYFNPDLDDHIYEYLLTSMAAVHAEDVRASFLFMGGLNGYHRE